MNSHPARFADPPYTYKLEGLFVCPECGHEWAVAEEVGAAEGYVVKDSNRNTLQNGDHDIDCKIEGFGAMALKSEFVKKA